MGSSCSCTKVEEEIKDHGPQIVLELAEFGQLIGALALNIMDAQNNQLKQGKQIEGAEHIINAVRDTLSGMAKIPTDSSAAAAQITAAASSTAHVTPVASTAPSVSAAPSSSTTSSNTV